MTALGAAHLGFLLLLASSLFAFHQLRRRDLDLISRVGLFVHLTGMSALWLRTDKPVEGPILLSLGPHHGLTAADLFVVVPMTLCLRLTGVVQPLRVSARENRR